MGVFLYKEKGFKHLKVWIYIDLQYSAVCSEDPGSSYLCGFEINLSLILCAWEGQIYCLEIFHPPGDIVTPATLRFTRKLR